FTSLSSFASNVISLCVFTSSHWLPCMCSFIIEFGTVSDSAATTILPLVAPGLAGSNVTVPLTPLALPLMASRGASSLNWALFTPLGSLKSKVSGPATATEARPAITNRETICFFMQSVWFSGCCLVWFTKEERRTRKASRGQQAGAQKIHARQEGAHVGDAFDAGDFVQLPDLAAGFGPAAIRAERRPAADNS